MPVPRVPHSFELYPPRTPAAAAALPAALDALAATGPSWFSVTFGAAGSGTDASFDLVRLLRARTGVEVMAHLTCAGSSHAQATALVRRFLDDGVHRFLAVRGDRRDDAGPTDLRSAAELVQLIHRVQAEREPWALHPLPGLPGVQSIGEDRPRAHVAVAAFVNGHPDARGRTDHLDALLAKQVAGAELAITQLFFHPEDYVAFVQRARRWGVTIPIVPGVLPVTSPARLRRALELSGEDEPRDLAIALEIEPTVEGQREIGIAHATAFAEALLAAGAPALHLYTFNQSDAVLEVLHRLGLIHTKEPA
ncbi:methylenetetrahydrofolate reductase [Amnibacterium sp.]|uniref:methylenetetrahydrofolate reductase n=1 Tax=Amnibacterium sp. TaxID=1872496 RepID=UPI00261C6CEA|nr:methylenetetrahydrofolate reductase [Amnibacterium sp.]MCU1473132.1 5,10-methylenetetrahydrofolate reductase [Amnibacterium sp.]